MRTQSASCLLTNVSYRPRWTFILTFTLLLPSPNLLLESECCPLMKPVDTGASHPPRALPYELFWVPLVTYYAEGANTIQSYLLQTKSFYLLGPATNSHL